MCPFSPKAKHTFFLIRVHLCPNCPFFGKYGINPYLRPLNQSANQPINDICSNASALIPRNPKRLKGRVFILQAMSRMKTRPVTFSKFDRRSYQGALICGSNLTACKRNPFIMVVTCIISTSSPLIISSAATFECIVGTIATQYVISSIACKEIDTSAAL